MGVHSRICVLTWHIDNLTSSYKISKPPSANHGQWGKCWITGWKEDFDICNRQYSSSADPLTHIVFLRIQLPVVRLNKLYRHQWPTNIQEMKKTSVLHKGTTQRISDIEFHGILSPENMSVLYNLQLASNMNNDHKTQRTPKMLLNSMWVA